MHIIATNSSILKKIKILIPDGETNLIFSVVYSLILSSNAELYIISSHKKKWYEHSVINNNLKYSFYVKKYFVYANSCDSQWVTFINEKVELFNIDHVLPITELGIKRVLHNEALFQDKLIPLPSLSYFNIAKDKWSLYNHLMKYDLPCPQTTNYKNIADLNFEYPIIAKPALGSEGGAGVKLLDNFESVKQYINTSKYEKIIFQEFIEGSDISCNVFCFEGIILAYTMQQSSQSGKIRVAPQYEFTFFEDKVLLNILKQLMKSLDWSGVANIDLRYDTKEESFKIIEINPRFWLNTEASALAGVNFPHMSCVNRNGQLKEVLKAKPITFYHLHALLQKIKRTPLLLFDFRFLKNQTSIRFVLNDPIVTLLRINRWLINKINLSLIKA